jgi:hypothetical protein
VAVYYYYYTMTPRSTISRELIDYIIDYLYDQPSTLKNCCLVSKAWVPPSRSHIFSKVVVGERVARPFFRIFLPPSSKPKSNVAPYVRSLLLDWTSMDGWGYRTSRLK